MRIYLLVSADGIVSKVESHSSLRSNPGDWPLAVRSGGKVFVTTRPPIYVEATLYDADAYDRLDDRAAFTVPPDLRTSLVNAARRVLTDPKAPAEYYHVRAAFYADSPVSTGLARGVLLLLGEKDPIAPPDRCGDCGNLWGDCVCPDPRD